MQTTLPYSTLCLKILLTRTPSTVGCTDCNQESFYFSSYATLLKFLATWLKDKGSLISYSCFNTFWYERFWSYIWSFNWLPLSKHVSSLCTTQCMFMINWCVLCCYHTLTSRETQYIKNRMTPKFKWWVIHQSNGGLYNGGPAPIFGSQGCHHNMVGFEANYRQSDQGTLELFPITGRITEQWRVHAYIWVTSRH